MKKRIIISESEKKNILSQHKQTIKNESELRKQSLSERELSNLVGRVLIKEQLEQIPGLPEGMEDCISKITTIKDNPKMQVKIAMACMSLDVEKCSKAIMDVGIEMGKKVLSNPMILVTFGNDAMNFAKCAGDKFGMDSMEIPVNNIASSRPQEMKEVTSNQCSPACKFPQKCINGKCTTTTSLKEGAPCKSEKDCPPNTACYNGKCSVTTSAKQMKEGRACRPGETACGGGCCPRGSSCRLGMCQSGISQPTAPIFNESESELDEIIYEIEFDEEINEQPKTIIKKPVPLKGRTCPEGWYRCGGGCCPSSGGGAGFTSGCKDGQCYYTYTTTSEPTKF